MLLIKNRPIVVQFLVFLLLFPGIATAALEPRIVGGFTADAEKRGFMAYLVGVDDKRPVLCGGALIEEDWILTAAHCVDDLTTVTLRVILGGQEVPTLQEIENNWRKLSVVKRIVVHQSYDIDTGHNDIALLQLERPAKKGKISIIDSVSLSSEISSGATVYAFGRGTQKPLPAGYENHDDGSTKLFGVDLPLVANDVCEDRLKARYADLTGGTEEHLRTNLSIGQLCAGGTTESKGTCHGDSGGPVMAAKNDGRVYLAGITSWAYGCAYYPTPGVFTRVPAYARAIDDVINGRSNDLKGAPVAGETEVLGDSGGGGGASNGGWWVILAMFWHRRRSCVQHFV